MMDQGYITDYHVWLQIMRMCNVQGLMVQENLSVIFIIHILFLKFQPKLFIKTGCIGCTPVQQKVVMEAQMYIFSRGC